MGVFLRSDKKYDVYSRKVNDILTLMGDIGGLSEALLAIGMLLVGFISQKMFMSKIVRKIYHIRKYDNIDHEALKHSSKQGGSVTPGTKGRDGPSLDDSEKVGKLDEENLMQKKDSLHQNELDRVK